MLGALQHCPNSAPREAVLWENGDLVNLNTLIPAGSGVILIGATNANDRGEIVAEGRLSNGDMRALVLIPCDEDHPDLDECQYEPVDSHTAARVRPPQITESSASASGAKFVPTEMMTRYRSALTRRYQRFGPLPQK